MAAGLALAWAAAGGLPAAPWAPLPAVAAETAGAVSFERGRVTLHLADGQTFPIAVEIARTPEQLTHGLMFRRALAAGSGMLFDFSTPRPVAMWMKNTLIPLDMLFIDTHGRVVHVEEEAAPGSLNPRGPDLPVLGVLELPGGTARRLGLHPGDRVVHPMFRD